jgi:hypothetical protein
VIYDWIMKLSPLEHGALIVSVILVMLIASKVL